MINFNFLRRVFIFFVIGAPLLFLIVWGYQTFFIHTSDTIYKEIKGPFNHAKGHCYTVTLPEFARGADTSFKPEKSTLIIFEDGRALGPGHSVHETIQKIGRGRFSHWSITLFFSTSDNSDPNKNGRKYSISISASSLRFPFDRLLTFGFLGLMLSGGVAGLILMVLFSHKSGMKRWSAFLAIINLGLIILLFFNIVPLLPWYGKFIYISIFIYLLICFSSLFLISHEIFGKINPNRNKAAFLCIIGWCGVGIFVLLFEVFFRIFPVYDTLALNPGIKFFWPDWVYYPVNSMGYRDRPFDLNKNSQTYRIMVVGDSYTEGSGYRRPETFSGVMQQTLNNRLQAMGCLNRVEVFNLGRCGANTVEEVQTILQETTVLKPDLVILAYVLNDPEVHPPDIKTFDPPPWVRAIHKMFLEEIHSYAYYWMFKNFTLFRGPVSSYEEYCLAIHKRDYHGWKKASDAIATLSKFKKEKDFDLLVIIFPIFIFNDYPTDLRRVHKKVLDMMHGNDMEAIDLLQFFEANDKNLWEFRFSDDDPHPNSLAHKLLGEYLAESVWERKSFKPVRETCTLN
jgi:hypothetical protein